MMTPEQRAEFRDMKECLQRCSRFVSMFDDFSIVNMPKVIATVRKADNEMNLKQLFADIKRLAQ